MNIDITQLQLLYESIHTPYIIGHNHEDYKTPIITPKEYEDVFGAFVYSKPISYTINLIGINDESIQVYGANSMQDLLDLVNDPNRSPFFDPYEEPVKYDVETLLKLVNDSYADKDSSTGYIIVDMSNLSVVAGGNISPHIYTPASLQQAIIDYRNEDQD